MNEDQQMKTNDGKRPASLNTANQKASAAREIAKHKGEEEKNPRTRESSESVRATRRK